MPYDSKPETLEHIRQVRRYIHAIIGNLRARADEHDKSKMLAPEKEMYDEFTPKLRATTFGSSEYAQHLREMGPALEHHYEVNTHHPQHYPNGIDGMSLLDLVEMLADWKAATMRHADGDIMQSLMVNQERFQITPQLADILHNTLIELDWIDPKK